MNPGYDVTTSTPWGKADRAYKYARGIINYSCPGHGGFHLSKTRNAQVHDTWRNDDGWYEEDCDWAVVALTFPEYFSESQVKAAHSTARDYFPDGYTAAGFGSVAVEDSSVLRRRAFEAEHVDDWVSVSAWGSWADWVPEGQVGLLALKGAGPRLYGDTRPQEWFLVPKDEYKNTTFVIDPERHPVATVHP